MNNQLTINEASEVVKESVGDVFSRDAVLSLLSRIKVQESVNVDLFRQLILDQKRTIQDEISGVIENNWNELVDYDEVELSLDCNQITLDAVGMCNTEYVFRNLAENIVDMLTAEVDELEASLNAISISKPVYDEEQGPVCE